MDYSVCCLCDHTCIQFTNMMHDRRCLWLQDLFDCCVRCTVLHNTCWLCRWKCEVVTGLSCHVTLLTSPFTSALTVSDLRYVFLSLISSVILLRSTSLYNCWYIQCLDHVGRCRNGALVIWVFLVYCCQSWDAASSIRSLSCFVYMTFLATLYPVVYFCVV